MKKTCIILIMMAGIFTAVESHAQIRKIPAEVTETLRDKYPMATDLEWRDKIRGFTASFELDGQKHLANFNNEGIWESTETTIEEETLPSVVKDSYAKSKYAEWEVGLVQKIEMPEEKIQYRVQAIRSEIRKKNLYFNSEGRMLKDRMTL